MIYHEMGGGIQYLQHCERKPKMQISQHLPEALGEYAHRRVARFHMPGHKGRGMGGFFRKDLIGWDVTELSFSDDLHAPEAAIAHAQKECALRFGAAHTFFLVNGSTAGILAMLLSLPQGADVLIGRDCHRAALSGIALSGHNCRFVETAYDPLLDLWGCVTPEALHRALCEHPAQAVLVTSPNYYGLCADIPALYEVACRHGSLLFVDAAHGAHFPFSQALPQSPAGFADAWVNSAHKTLNALGQAALLHIGPRMPVFAVQRALSLVQTSSPSYLLLASLDWARYTAELNDCWTTTADACASLTEKVNEFLGLRVLPRTLIGTAGVADMDRTRIVIDAAGRGITGYTAQRVLERNDVFVEMADHRRVVCICTPADDPAWYGMLLDALRTLPYGTQVPERTSHGLRLHRAMPLHEAVRAEVERLPLRACAGHIAADAAGVYPPGIPLWTPGECISAEAIAYLSAQQALGASLFGITEGKATVVRDHAAAVQQYISAQA